MRSRRIRPRSSSSSFWQTSKGVRSRWSYCFLVNQSPSPLCCGVRFPFVGNWPRKSHSTARNMPLNLSADISILEERSGVYIFAATMLGFIGFFGFVLNLLVIVTVVKNAKVLWTPNNVILVNMIVSISILIIKFEFSG